MVDIICINCDEYCSFFLRFNVNSRRLNVRLKLEEDVSQNWFNSCKELKGQAITKNVSAITISIELFFFELFTRSIMKDI